MATHIPVMQEEETNKSTSYPVSALMTVVATTDNASQSEQQKQQHIDAAAKSNSLLNKNNNKTSSSGEKDESNMITTTMTTGFQNYSNIKVIRVKKKTAHRTSLHEFFKKAAMVAAARQQQQQQRPATRRGGRRENTNIFTTAESLIEKKKPRFSNTTTARKKGSAGASLSSSSVKSHDSISSGGVGGGSHCSSSSNSRKRKGGTNSDHNKGPVGSVNKKHKKVAPSTDNQITDHVDNPEVAKTQPKTNSTSMMVEASTSNTAASQQAAASRINNNSVATAVATAAGTATSLGTAQQDLVSLPYRPDTALEKEFPVIPLPRATDVIMGRGSRVAKHHGNILFRGIVRNHKKRYSSPLTKKNEKHKIAEEVVEMVVQSGGRFLELAEEFGGTVLTGPWRHAPYAKCVEKSSQALRELKWNYSVSANTPSPSPTGTSKIPVEDPDSIPPPAPGGARSLTARVESPTPPTTRSRSPAVTAKTGAKPTARGGAAPSRQHNKSSSEPNRSKNNATTTTKPTTQRGEGHGSFASIKEQHQQQVVVANKEQIIVNKDSRTVEEQMSRLQDGSRVAIYWPLDTAYYEGTVEDRLQDNFFYIRYDDGESEWLDLNKHAFKVLSAPAPVPAKARAATKVAAKKKSNNKIDGSRDKEESSRHKTETSNKKESNHAKAKSSNKEAPVNVKQQQGRGVGTPKVAGKVPSYKKIRSSSQRSKQILDSIAKHGTEDWELVASEVPDWSAEDCRRRYELYLDPTLSKDPFTKDELQEIMLLQSKEGNDWAAIAPNLTVPRSCVLLSDKWNRKIRNIILSHLQNLGLTRKQIDGNDKKQINYHGHFEEVLAVVAASKL